MWEKNKLAFTGRIGVNIGYNLIERLGYKLVPVSGIGFGFMSSKLISGEDYKNEFENEPFFPYFKLGLFYESKAIHIGKNVRINNEDAIYSHLRFGVEYTTPIGKIRYKNFYSGSQISFTIGIAVLRRKFYKI
jgi:hypothetical protein